MFSLQLYCSRAEVSCRYSTVSIGPVLGQTVVPIENTTQVSLLEEISSSKLWRIDCWLTLDVIFMLFLDRYVNFCLNKPYLTDGNDVIRCILYAIAFLSYRYPRNRRNSHVESNWLNGFGVWSKRMEAPYLCIRRIPFQGKSPPSATIPFFRAKVRLQFQWTQHPNRRHQVCPQNIEIAVALGLPIEGMSGPHVAQDRPWSLKKPSRQQKPFLSKRDPSTRMIFQAIVNCLRFTSMYKNK
jgi:hypothetical protein